MTQSMTGYANTTIDIIDSENQKLSLSIQIKSLNSRYFEATCKIPYLLTNLEVAIQKNLKQKLQRGHVYVTIKMQQGGLKQAVVPAVSTIQSYINAIEVIKKECNIADKISLQTILQLPNVFQTEDELLQKTTETNILDEINTLVDELILMRVEEGKILQHDICNQIQTVEQKLTLIKTASSQTIQEKKEKLDSVIVKLQDFAPDNNSIEKSVLENQKIMLLSELDKIDIHEEIIRANAHASSILLWLNGNELTKGKKLDFVLQELNREINTIASKCSDFTISTLAIDIKSELEKCREQAQNIV